MYNFNEFTLLALRRWKRGAKAIVATKLVGGLRGYSHKGLAKGQLC